MGAPEGGEEGVDKGGEEGDEERGEKVVEEGRERGVEEGVRKGVWSGQRISSPVDQPILVHIPLIEQLGSGEGRRLDQMSQLSLHLPIANQIEMQPCRKAAPPPPPPPTRSVVGGFGTIHLPTE